MLALPIFDLGHLTKMLLLTFPICKMVLIFSPPSDSCDNKMRQCVYSTWNIVFFNKGEVLAIQTLELFESFSTVSFILVNYLKL